MMSAVCILGSGMVSAVGLDAPSSCAAIRCALDNFQETRFIDQGGEWQIAATVPLEQPWLGRTKLIRMAARAIAEALRSVPGCAPEKTPLLLGLAEAERPGRLDGLDISLLHDIERELGLRFHDSSNVIPRGRVSGAVALLNARKLIHEQGHRHVLIAGVDSFLAGSTLAAYEERERLLTSQNSNGFVPGEGAAAVVIGAPVASEEPQLACIGIGFGMEKATVEAEDIPLRAEGLTQAVRTALAEAGCGLERVDYRLTDLSGEQYYFREAALALSRVLRLGAGPQEMCSPADCIGEIGAAIGCSLLVLALNGHVLMPTPMPSFLLHTGNDGGERSAIVLSFQTVRAAS